MYRLTISSEHSPPVVSSRRSKRDWGGKCSVRNRINAFHSRLVNQLTPTGNADQLAKMLCISQCPASTRFVSCKSQNIDYSHDSNPQLCCFTCITSLVPKMSKIYICVPRIIGLFSVQFSLIFIARQHTDVRYWYSKSVRPSVCLSVTFRYQMKTA